MSFFHTALHFAGEYGNLSEVEDQLEVVLLGLRDLLEDKLVVVGNLTQQPLEIESYHGNPDDVLKRIREDYEALKGAKVDPGNMCWIGLTDGTTKIV